MDEYGSIGSSKFINKLTALLTASQNFLNSLKAVFGITYIQTKFLTANVNTDGVVADITFNNLEIGKWYAIGGQLVGQTGADDGWLAEIYNDDTTATQTNRVGRKLFNSDGPNVAQLSEFATRKFKATGSKVYFVLTSMSGNSNTILEGNGTRRDTYVQLEELPNHVETTKFN